MVRMSYNQHKLYQSNQKMMDWEVPLRMIDYSLILHLYIMGMKCAEDPFNIDSFYLRCLS